jgi:cytochrome c oxidase accessory protein FixG
MLGFSGTREWVYPQSIRGRFMTLRRWTFFGLHLVLFVLPWITMNGHPLLRVDLPARRVYLFGSIFTASDTVFLLLLLLFLAFSLFFFTAIFGRVWCGYACPQTVFLETWIRPLELWIEGDRSARKRRDTAGPTLDKVWRKLVKWGLFAAVSLLLSMAFMSILSGARELWTGHAGPVAYALVAIFAGAWFLDFVWFREQFCSYLCPYARFQSALADDHSLTISYDTARGEPRGKGPAVAAAGRCIECSKCVAVCPQGIDIRNGFQLECIQCARCIDACASVMAPLGHRTLVLYNTIAAAEGRPVRKLRPRTVVYGLLMASLTAVAIVGVAARTSFEATVNRAPGSLFTVDADGWVRNTFLLSLTNNDPSEAEQLYHVTVEGLPDAQVIIEDVRLRSTESRVVPLIVRVPQADTVARTVPLVVRVQSPTEQVVLETTFKSGSALNAQSSRP